MHAFPAEPADRYGELWAEVYDTELAHMVVTDAQLDLLAGLAGDGQALELGIGTGRVGIPLAGRGVRVEGVDASEAMVARLRAKPGGGAITVTIGDMVDPPVEGPFRLVFVVFNTLFGLVTQEAQKACFAAVARLLEPGGVFCCECFVPDLARFDRGQSLRTEAVDGLTTRLDAARHDPVAQTVTTNIITLRPQAPVIVRPVRLRYAWPSELDLMAELAGLRLDRRLAGWSGDPFGPRSGNHISLYRRPGPS